jgi:hypothetical protein
LPRSTWYYEARPESAENLRLMRRIDKEYTAHPFFGSRQMTAVLQRQRFTTTNDRISTWALERRGKCTAARLLGTASATPSPGS